MFRRDSLRFYGFTVLWLLVVGCWLLELLSQPFKQKGLAEASCKITYYAQYLRRILAVLYHAASTAVPFDEAFLTFRICIDRVLGNQLMKLVVVNDKTIAAIHMSIYTVIVVCLIG